jgi:hypothetical protein
MRSMTIALSLATTVAGSLATAGCYTTVRQSTVGPFVRSIDAYEDGILVQSCSIKQYEEIHHNVLNFFFDLQPDRNFEFTQDQCGGGFTSLAAPAARITP